MAILITIYSIVEQGLSQDIRAQMHNDCKRCNFEYNNNTPLTGGGGGVSMQT